MKAGASSWLSGSSLNSQGGPAKQTQKIWAINSFEISLSSRESKKAGYLVNSWLG